MTKVKRISGLLLLGGAGMGVIYLVIWLLEPKHEGRTANSWFLELCRQSQTGAIKPESTKALLTLGDRAAPYLAKAYARRDPEWSQPLIRWLQEKGVSNSPSERTRYTCAQWLLTDLGPRASGAIPALAKVAADKSHRRRRGAIQLIGIIHRKPGIAVPVLIDCLCETNGYVRTFAATALGAFAGEARAALDPLHAALDANDTYLAIAAAAALLQIDRASDAGWPLLLDSLRSPVATHRVEAARALGSLGMSAFDAVPLLKKCLTDDDERVRRAANGALQQIDARSSEIGTGP